MKLIELSSSPYVKQQKKKEFQNGLRLKKLEKAWKSLKKIEKYLKLLYCSEYIEFKKIYTSLKFCMCWTCSK